MELLTLFFIVVMCAFAYILGYRQKEQENSQSYKSNTTKQYNRISEDHCDEEALVERTPQPKPAEEVNSEKDTLIKDQQKEIDRLMRQLTDFKKREQKNVAEIQYLKTKITSSTVGTSSNPSNNQGSDLITDKGFTDLLDEASQNLKDNEDIDEDELSKQIDQSLL
ncbi:transmembrane protein, putative (macronuclear) [Tetrahymena thermophila SB210]|uniref:Transmembrane protein, putative n=1 Tax=Tetrahymena thermophila (strain SB210) TaxID=312017 RepID=I7LUX4_TETTS|nr:transmembrane protein, putative [Tetrahymena thermophila SB210]EAR96223.2 transmembrane protein, putative [Tetrahymena thermophila SB210]|eukprot:XP_001016468.2 transmembrane protein, putative [Tetrahymena thermophila SB210]